MTTTIEGATASKRTVAEIRLALWEAFPACFAAKGQSKAPLKLGIHKDILAAGGFTSREIYAAIHDYTGGPTYLRNLIDAADRIDLDGQPCGKVTADEAKHAKMRLKKRRRWVNQNTLIEALTEAREFVALNLSELLESCCVLDKDTLQPIRDTLDDMDRPEVERGEAVLARIDAAIAKARAS